MPGFVHLMRCVGGAVVKNGLRALASLVPMGASLCNIAHDTLEKYRKERREAELAAEIAAVAQAQGGEVRRVAEQVVREVAADQPADVQAALAAYLSQIPAACRQSLRRPDDPTGTTVPANLALRRPEDLMRFLPDRLPCFKPGAHPLPGVDRELIELRRMSRRRWLWAAGAGGVLVPAVVGGFVFFGCSNDTHKPDAPAKDTDEILSALRKSLVRVHSGSFWMVARGSQKQVPIPKDFYIGKFLVTQEQWRAVMGNNPSWFSRNEGGADKVKDISDADLGQFPVESVSWDDDKEHGVQEFLKRLNAREKDSGFLCRLSTEAEWEYSCRAGATSQEDCAFDFYFSKPTNDLSSEQANFDGNHPVGKALPGKYLERTTKVGSYQPNRLGLYDMHGNVWEWCADLYEAGGSARVVRGGCWDLLGASCRASARDGYEPAYRGRDVGVRLAAVPSGK